VRACSLTTLRERAQQSSRPASPATPPPPPPRPPTHPSRVEHVDHCLWVQVIKLVELHAVPRLAVHQASQQPRLRRVSRGGVGWEAGSREEREAGSEQRCRAPKQEAEGRRRAAGRQARGRCRAKQQLQGCGLRLPDGWRRPGMVLPKPPPRRQVAPHPEQRCLRCLLAYLNGARLELVKHLLGVVGGEAAQQHAGSDCRLAGRGGGVQQVLAQQGHQLARAAPCTPSPAAREGRGTGTHGEGSGHRRQ
jgi:hypothetical protein